MKDIDRSMTRAWAEIDLSAIRNNFLCARDYAKASGADLLCVVKADAYGHGAGVIAKELESVCDASYFAVATFFEALELAEAGIVSPKLILSEVHPSLYPELVTYENILPSLFRYESAKALSAEAVKAGKTIPCFLVLDTGMSRIGFECSTSEKKASSLDEIEKIASLPGLSLAGIFSHFARADESDKSDALRQVERFDDFLSELKQRGIDPPKKSLCNSAALTESEFTEKYDLVREGILLYGLKPSDEVADVLPIRPAMSLKAIVTDVKTLEAGVGISYGHTFVTERETKVATIPVGYADGYPRLLSGKAGVLIDGQWAPILGRVCMDQMMVDVTGIENVEIGSVAVLIGEDERIRPDRLAALYGSIGYEILCAVSPRIPRVYIQSALPSESQRTVPQK